MQNLEFQWESRKSWKSWNSTRKLKNHSNLRIPLQHHGNHENIIIPLDNQEIHANPIIYCKNYENQ